MPNHVTSRWKITGSREDIDAFKKKMLSQTDQGEPFFDFNGVIPMPEALKSNTSTNYTTEFFALGVAPKKKGSAALQIMDRFLSSPLGYTWVKKEGIKTREELLAYLEKRRPEQLAKAKKAAANIEKYGYQDWYDWSIDNWGTKWGAYSLCLDNEVSFSLQPGGELKFTFDTAWSFPDLVFNKIAEDFPNLCFSVVFFDEGWCFAGRASAVDGIPTIDSGEATDELYEEVYGYPPEKYDEEEAG